MENLETFLKDRSLSAYNLILLIFGSVFLSLANQLCSKENVCGYIAIKIDVNSYSPISIFQYLAFSYILGFILYTSGVWLFRFFRKYIFRKYNSCYPNINDVQINEYFEKNKSFLDVYKLQQFDSTLFRPLLSIFISSAILFFPIKFLFSQNLLSLIIILIIVILFLIAGASSDESVNKLGDQVKKILTEQQQK